MDAMQFHLSFYYKAADFLAGPLVLIIQDCMLIRFKSGEQKYGLSFVGAHKRLPLNKTNTATLISLFGREATNWAGKAIECYVDKVLMKGRIVDSIRLRLPQQPVASQSFTAQPQHKWERS